MARKRKPHDPGRRDPNAGPVPDNPVKKPIDPDKVKSGERYHEDMEDGGQRYRIGPTMLGGHSAGEVVTAKELGPGAQIQRLIDQGYLIPVDDDYEEEESESEAADEEE
jgi:hypothetical protein